MKSIKNIKNLKYLNVLLRNSHVDPWRGVYFIIINYGSKRLRDEIWFRRKLIHIISEHFFQTKNTVYKAY
jgi:hypothetical protein